MARQNTIEKFKEIETLYEAGIAMMRQNIKRRNLQYSDEEVEKKLLEWMCFPDMSPAQKCHNGNNQSSGPS